MVGRRFQIVLRGGSRGGADASPGSAAAAEKRRRRLRRRGPGADGLTPRQRLLRRSDAFWHFMYLTFFRGVAGRLPTQRAIPASVRPAPSSQVEAALLHPPRTGARGTWTTSSRCSLSDSRSLLPGPRRRHSPFNHPSPARYGPRGRVGDCVGQRHSAQSQLCRTRKAGELTKQAGGEKTLARRAWSAGYSKTCDSEIH